MAPPFYKLVLAHGFTEAWYQLSEEEQGKFWAAVGENLERQGVKKVGPSYNCRWSTDKYASFFILEYPTIEAAIADTAGCEGFDFYRYLEVESILAVVDEAVETNQGGAP